MQTLDLNLATHPFRNNTLLWVGLALALIAIGAVTMWNVQTYRDSTQGLAELRQRAGDIESRRNDLDVRDQQALQAIGRYDLGPLFVRADKANEVIRWKAFSWTRLFNLLQDVQPYGVQMATISPVFRTEGGSGVGRIDDPDIVPVTVDGIARGLGDFLEFQQDLLADPHFDRVEPVRATTDPNSGETVFQLRFHYDPRVGDELDDELDDELVAEADTAGTEADAGEIEAGELQLEQLEPTEPLEGALAEEIVAAPGQDLLDESEKVAALQATDTPGSTGEPGDGSEGRPDAQPDAPTGSAGAVPVEPDPAAATAVEQPDEERPKKRNPRRRGRKGKNRGAPTNPVEESTSPQDAESGVAPPQPEPLAEPDETADDAPQDRTPPEDSR